MKIEVSDRTFVRLQQRARPLIDSVDDVINDLLDQHPQKGNSTVSNVAAQSIAVPTASNTPTVGATTIQGLRGFQKELWDLILAQMPNQRFTLQDVYARKGPLVNLRPHVQEIEASIRAGLEKLRDKGLLEFVDNRGTYRRLA